jgi:hypothetical protein
MLLPLLSAVAAENQPGRPATARCELILDGKAIDGVNLETTDFRFIEAKPAGGVILLPPGRYRVAGARLDGGRFHHHYRPEAPGDWFELQPGKPHRLALGAPLRPVVQVKRRGSRLMLDYVLVDGAGREYAGRGSNPARFTIFRDGRQVGTGRFEYG